MPAFFLKYFLFFIVFIAITDSCKKNIDSNERMVGILKESYKKFRVKENPFSSEAVLEYYDSLLASNIDEVQRMDCLFGKGKTLIELGRENEAIAVFENMIPRIPDPYDGKIVLVMKKYALAYLRKAERDNCITGHTAESCIVPIRGTGIHRDKTGSTKSIEILSKILERHPMDYESRWLLNIAYMTLGGYPDLVPRKWLVPGLDSDPEDNPVKGFIDVAPLLGLNIKSMAGGAIVDDFNHDGYLDIVTSESNMNGGMHYFRNDGKGGFIDLSVKSNLSRFLGGLNINHADYDNDGDPDILVLRGGWWKKYGKQPHSLLRNNGDETFTDVTIESGMFSEYPTQTAVWRDFNKDGWLDLFIGHETSEQDDPYPCEFYINNRNGTFTESAAKAGCKIIDYVKGVAAGDYDNDGLEDLFLSCITGNKILLKNNGVKNNIPQFIDVTESAGLSDIQVKTFPTWFWDVDNDGWLDLFISGYYFGESIAHTACTEALGIKNEASHLYLYLNNRDGTFRNKSKEAGLHKSVFTMGSNFGDIDNDGYLDMYLGTGNPEYESLVPNRLFRNLGDGRFSDVTVSGRVGNLQKGHGVAFADLDEDGDQDIFIEMGGAYLGDAYSTSLYMNPGQNDHHWIKVKLEGTESNKMAIGSRIKLIINENGMIREIYRDVNSGGSFGSSPYRREIGIGKASRIDQLIITWHKTGKQQIFRDLEADQFIKVKEGQANFEIINLPELQFAGDSSKINLCKPI